MKSHRLLLHTGKKCEVTTLMNRAINVCVWEPKELLLELSQLNADN